MGWGGEVVDFTGQKYSVYQIDFFIMGYLLIGI